MSLGLPWEDGTLALIRQPGDQPCTGPSWSDLIIGRGVPLGYVVLADKPTRMLL
jgi:hypothetical protein